jgi:hypothetical protein
MFLIILIFLYLNYNLALNDFHRFLVIFGIYCFLLDWIIYKRELNLKKDFLFILFMLIAIIVSILQIF